jgi:diacylglycerol O-acyltransferase
MKPPVLSRRMSGTDAAFLYLERKEIPVPVAGLFILDGPIPFDDFSASLDSKLDLIPKYRQIVSPAPFHIGHPTWAPDPHFDVSRHILRVRLKKGTDAELESLAGRLVGETLDRNKPLWDIHVVDGLKNGRGAFILRIHHALCDGVSAAGILNVILDPSPKYARPRRKPRSRLPQARVPEQSTVEVVGGAVRSILDSLVSVEGGVLGMASALLPGNLKETAGGLLSVLPELLAPVEPLPFNKQCSGDRKFCWTEFDFAPVQAVRAAAGGTLNDVVLTALVRALARYCEMHGQSVVNRLVRIVCPVNVQAGRQLEELGNQITFLPVVLPMGVRDPLRHVREVSSRMEIMKNARAADLVALLGNWIGSTPAPVQRLFWYGLPLLPLPLPLFNMICTNIPGSRVPLYAAGRRVLAAYPHVPTGYVLGVNFAVHSYDGKLFFGFTADAHAAPDVGRLRDFLSASFRELCRAAGVKQPRRQAARPARVKAAAPVEVPASPEPAAPEPHEKPAAMAARA